MGQLVAQRLPVKQFGNNVVDPFLQANIVYREDVGMIEGGDSLRFLFKTQEAVFVLSK